MFKKQIYFIMSVILLLTTSTVNTLTAQKATVNTDNNSRFKQTLGETFELDNVKRSIKDGKGNVYILGTRTSGFFKLDKYFLLGFDNALNKVFEKPYVEPVLTDKELTLITVLLVNDKPTFFYQSMGKTGRGQLLAATLAQDGVLGKPRQVGAFESDEAFTSCNVTASPDNLKIMVYAELKHTEAKLPLVFKVFDNQLNEIWKRKESFVTSESAAKSAISVVRSAHHGRQLLLDNSGRVFVSVPVARGTSEGKNSRDNLFKVYQFAQDQAESKVYTIELGKNVIHYFNVIPSKNKDELICFGTYAGTSKVTLLGGEAGTMGTFHGRLNLTKGEVSPITVQQFSDDVFDFMSVNDKKVEDGNGLKCVSAWQHYVTERNNLVIILEQNYLETLTIREANNTTRTLSTANSDLAFVVKYAENGAFVYQDYIKKKSAGDFALHVSSLFNAEDPVIIYNDAPKNFERDIKHYRNIEPVGWGLLAKSPQPYIYTYDKSGHSKGMNLFEKSKESFILQPALMHLQYAPQSVLMFVTSSKNTDKCKLIRIDY